MKKTFKRIVKLLLSMLLFCVDQLVGLFPGRCCARCIILYYHAVTDADAEKFAHQMDKFQSRVKPVAAIEEIPATATGRFGMVTFDDGYVSVVKNALPLLRSRNIPCIMFITTGSIGKKPQWVSDPAHPFHAERVVGEQEIGRLGADDMVTIGSHGVNHSNSRELSDREFVRELTESRQRLESAAGKHSVAFFSFPHGKFLPKHIGLAQTAGYSRVFSIEPSFEKPASAGFLLGRISVGPADWALEFFLKVSGAYRWQTWKVFKRNAGE